MKPDFWRNRSVFITGHTGFKGGWLSLVLEQLGAKVHGYALPSTSSPNLFDVCGVADHLVSSTFGDIRDLNHIQKAVNAAEPSIIFHLAAQALVIESYSDPVETYSTNVMGTVNILEAARLSPTVEAIVNVTTDKVYENHEWIWPYREDDRLGGHDPYSNSKACAELVSMAYRNSFLSSQGIQLATARAGNVIGGGDWANNRLVPDIFRALSIGQPIQIRNPSATRPWQHVLEPISGYLELAEKLTLNDTRYSEAWNFGPKQEDVRTVAWILDKFKSLNPNLSWNIEKTEAPHEALSLQLDISKSLKALDWTPKWDLGVGIEKTYIWYEEYERAGNIKATTLKQIDEYLNG